MDFHHRVNAHAGRTAVCAGACGAAALYLVAGPDRLAGMLHRTLAALDSFLQGYGDDGACAEGIGYWEYGFGFYVYFAELLRERTGGRLDLLASPKVQRIARFPAAVRLDGDGVVSFSDSPLRFRTRAGLMCRLAERTGAPLPPLDRIACYQDDSCHRWVHLARDLFWTPHGAPAAPPAPPTGFVYFPDVQWVIDRRTGADGTFFAWAAKGGHNAEPHNHNDLGHFILHAAGQTLLCDLGAGEYTRQYFGPQRYEFLHNGSHGHSVPEIGGHRQAAGAGHRAQVLQAEPGLFHLDLTGAYPDPNLVRFHRLFRCRGPAPPPALPGIPLPFAPRAALELEVEDRFAFAAPPQSLAEVFISLLPPTLLAPGAVRWGDGPCAVLQYDPDRLQPAVERVEAAGHRGAPLTAYRLVLTAVDPPQEVTYRFRFTALA